MQHGIVYLVGAGPGDPGLITVRGADLLKSADVVIYDYLSNPQLLSHCPSAKTIYVGKKAAQHSMPQEQINELLVAHGKAGKRVVRLKGGDPFVFGRGGEECESLAAAGIPFEVVPGITAALAAPAYAGIPVTHRDLNSSFTFVTGHEKEEAYRETEAQTRLPGAASDLDWAALAKLPCLAFYMGVKSLPRICSELIEHGMDVTMPAATIRWGTTPRQKTLVGTISTLAGLVAEAALGPPALTIVGRVVELRSTIGWFEHRPLFGQTIVVTRTRQQASELTFRLAELGANVIEAPTIELAAPEDWSNVDESLKSLAAFDWVIFTSQNGVEAARNRLIALGLDSRAFGHAKIAAIGDATAKAVRDQLFLSVNLRPQQFVAEALADALAEKQWIRDSRFLLLRVDIARPILRDRLIEGGAAEVRDVPIYQTRLTKILPSPLVDALAAGEVNWITFTSSSTVKGFISLLGPDAKSILGNVKLASIGPITTRTVRELGWEPTVEATRFDIDGLVNSIVSDGK